MKMNFYFVFFYIVIFLLSGCAENTVQWHSLGEQKTLGISGIAPIDSENFLVVHDGKKTEHPRLSIVTWKEDKQPVLKQIDWCNDSAPPIDLEAIAVIPNRSKEYLLLESKGKVTRIQLENNKSCNTIAQFDLPTSTAKSNMEGLALSCFTQKCVLVWAERGDDKQAAILSWSEFDIDRNIVAKPNKTPYQFNASYPSVNHRSISDISLDNHGGVWVSSASDPGDNGPFESALYKLGIFKEKISQIEWLPLSDNTSPFIKYQNENIKIEGISFITQDRLIMGTDDENMGGKIAILNTAK